MSDALYNDYKNNYDEYMKTVLYTEKIINDNNSDQNKLLNIYEKAIKSAENMFKRMQLEVETNSMIENAHNELNDMYNEISKCKTKLRKLKEEIMKKDQRNNELNNYDDRILLLSDVDLLEKGDVYINQSKILMDNTEYISNDVMKNLNKQREFCVKYNRYTKNNSNSYIQEKNNALIDFMNNEEINNLDNNNSNNLVNKLNDVYESNSIMYDFTEKNKNSEKPINNKNFHESSVKINKGENYFYDNSNKNVDEYNVNENEDENKNKDKDENNSINEDGSFNEN